MVLFFSEAVRKDLFLFFTFMDKDALILLNVLVFISFLCFQDFIVTAVFALMWLISSSAWAQGVTDLKYYSDPTDGIFLKLKECDMIYNNYTITCTPTVKPNFSTLDVSIVSDLQMCLYYKFYNERLITIFLMLEIEIQTF